MSDRLTWGVGGVRQGPPVGGKVGGDVIAPPFLKVTPDDVTQSQTLHITMSQQAEWRGSENGLRGQKASQISRDGKHAAHLIMAPINSTFC